MDIVEAIVAVTGTLVVAAFTLLGVHYQLRFSARERDRTAQSEKMWNLKFQALEKALSALRMQEYYSYFYCAGKSISDGKNLKGLLIRLRLLVGGNEATPLINSIDWDNPENPDQLKKIEVMINNKMFTFREDTIRNVCSVLALLDILVINQTLKTELLECVDLANAWIDTIIAMDKPDMTRFREFPENKAYLEKYVVVCNLIREELEKTRKARPSTLEK